MSPVDVQLTKRAGIAVAAVSGDVDLDGRDEFEAALEELKSSEGPAVIDLGEVPFMDSSGLHVVVSLWRSLRREGRSLALAGLRDPVRKLFELTALDSVLTIYDDADTAVAALRHGPPRVSARGS